VLPKQSPRKEIFKNPCESRKKPRIFAPRFDRRQKGLKSGKKKSLKFFFKSLTNRKVFLPLHPASMGSETTSKAKQKSLKIFLQKLDKLKSLLTFALPNRKKGNKKKGESGR
jgi:hypothetical protein